MFDRLKKPFLTDKTGEAYQPIRFTYAVMDKDKLIESLKKLQCLEHNAASDTWHWYWRHECADIHFESVDSFRKDPQAPIRLGTLSVKEDKLYIQLPTFKRACLAVTFFHSAFSENSTKVLHADFLNKVFSVDERLPHGFAELFKDEELNFFLQQRVEDYEKVKEQCEDAETAEQAFTMLAEYTKKEAQKRLPYAERYIFDLEHQDPSVVFLSFYIFLRGRELVAIKRWLGETGYTLSDASDETVSDVFGELGIDILD